MGVKEQIMLISVARFAQYFEMEKIICVFTHPDVSLRCQPTRNPHSFVTWKLIFSYLLKLCSPSYYLYYLYFTIRQLNPAKLSTRSILHLCVFFLHLQAFTNEELTRERNGIGCVKLDFWIWIMAYFECDRLRARALKLYLIFPRTRIFDLKKKRIRRTLCRQQMTTSRLVVLVPRFLFLFSF
jgi:hypothetical protein